MEKVTKCSLVLAIFLMANLGTGEGGRDVSKKEDGIVYRPQGLLPFWWWLKAWWLLPWWLKPFPPLGYLNKAPAAKVGWLNYDEDFMAKEYNYRLGYIPKVDGGDGSSP